jgi:hypothetical protein
MTWRRAVAAIAVAGLTGCASVDVTPKCTSAERRAQGR